MRYILLFLLALCLSASAQMKSEQDAVNLVSPPDKCIRGDSIHWTADQYAPLHKGWAVSRCKGALVNKPSPPGFLAVHLVGDDTGKWFRMYLDSTGVMKQCEFDLVGDSIVGTTVKIDTNLYIFPYRYKTVH